MIWRGERWNDERQYLVLGLPGGLPDHNKTPSQTAALWDTGHRNHYHWPCRSLHTTHLLSSPQLLGLDECWGLKQDAARPGTRQEWDSPYIVNGQIIIHVLGQGEERRGKGEGRRARRPHHKLNRVRAIMFKIMLGQEKENGSQPSLQKLAVEFLTCLAGQRTQVDGTRPWCRTSPWLSF